MAELSVNLGPSTYTIHIGANNLNSIKSILKNLQLTTKALVVSDDNVDRLYGEKLSVLMQEAGFETIRFVIKPGELSKCFDEANHIYTKAIETNLDRKSPVIALGGGVVGDLAGFVAATYLRGVPFIQIPTSLLAQVDSSVGGKVAVNHPLGKNLIGAFYQPKTVLIDTVLLNTLPEEELCSGLAEVIKHGLITDKKFFAYLNARSADIFKKDPSVLAEIVYKSCEIKAQVIEQDEKETGLRAILNFGHTIGHAVEKNAGFGQYSHGEAVAIGMHGAAIISSRLGLCGNDVVNAVRETLLRFHLPLRAEGCSPDSLVSFLARDKKTIAGKVNWILLKDIGAVTIENNVPADVVYRALQDIT